MGKDTCDTITPKSVQDAGTVSVVVLIQHDADDGPCYFGAYLRTRGIPYVHIRAYEGDAARRQIPDHVDNLLALEPTSTPNVFSMRPDGGGGLGVSDLSWDFGCIHGTIAAVASLGGWMSVNDDLPYYERVYSLFRTAVDAQVPVIGHCLGAQLLCKCLGGAVTSAPTVELGWTTQRALYSDPSTRPPGIHNWFGDHVTELPVFQWHGETFSIPPECTRIATGPHCSNQAFQYKDSFVIGMQFHVEVEAEKIDAWIAHGHQALFRNASERENAVAAGNVNVSPAAMTVDQLCADDREARIARSRQIADQVYGTWTQGLRIK